MSPGPSTNCARSGSSHLYARAHTALGEASIIAALAYWTMTSRRMPASASASTKIRRLNAGSIYRTSGGVAGILSVNAAVDQ